MELLVKQGQKKKERRKESNTMIIKPALSIIVGITLLAMFGAMNLLQSAAGLADASVRIAEPKAPMVASGDNLYVVWWTNKSGNREVMFRASTDNGATFGDKINLSNSTETDSENAEIVATGDNVYVSWWENSLQNGTSESVMRVSTDNGAKFGPLVTLGDNGALGTSIAE
jgi:hypothetical protein